MSYGQVGGIDDGSAAAWNGKDGKPHCWPLATTVVAKLGKNVAGYFAAPVAWTGIVYPGTIYSKSIIIVRSRLGLDDLRTFAPLIVSTAVLAHMFAITLGPRCTVEGAVDVSVHRHNTYFEVYSFPLLGCPLSISSDNQQRRRSRNLFSKTCTRRFPFFTAHGKKLSRRFKTDFLW